MNAGPRVSLQRKRILILANFFSGNGDRWIDDFCPGNRYRFIKKAHPDSAASWHQRGPVTALAEWRDHFRYARQGLEKLPDGLVTAFPQLALAASALLLARASRHLPFIAWNFNLGAIGGRLKGKASGQALRRVDRFVVHAREEIPAYARWLGLPESRFRFIPLQRGRVEVGGASPVAGGYLVSLGSAQRDYATLAAAVKATGLRTVIIARADLLARLPDDPMLIKLSGLSQQQCIDILAGAAVNVVPLLDTPTAAGQVTFITALRLGIPTIATACVGTRDYIVDGVTGRLVPAGDAAALRGAIVQLMADADLRVKLGKSGEDFAARECSDEVAGIRLAALLDEVTGYAS
ncbi:MAG: glycosyltransferase [Sulfuritalea sp.]|nr:glycosyltransferase [Sulfuritalea sp.]